jgi:DNA-binding FrmR family transcriptional regulator
MLESDMGCSDIIVQNMAAIWLIKSANNKLIEAFLETQYDESLNKKRKLLEIFKLSHK